MRRAFAALVLVGLATAVVVAGTKIKTQRNKTFDFATLRTWVWNPGGPGDVKVWVTAESKSEPIKRQFEPIIMQSVDRALTARGLTQASGGTPDFTVTYYLLVTAGTSAQQVGQFLPSTTEWGLPPLTPQTTSLRTYPMGTLVIDIGAPDPDHVVWRAVAQAEIELERTDAERAVRLQRVVKDVVAKLPRK